MIDLDRIEALAKAAQADETGILTDAQLAFACALSPQVVLELIELARGPSLFAWHLDLAFAGYLASAGLTRADVLDVKVDFNVTLKLPPMPLTVLDIVLSDGADDPEDDDMPFVCPGCQAFGGEPCAPGCIDSEDPEDDVPCLTCGRAECVCGQFSDDNDEAADEMENRA